MLLTNYSNLDDYDKVFISKVFTDTYVPEYILTFPNVTYGGTGFFYDLAPALPYEIEHHKPDYQLYMPWINEQVEKDKVKWESLGNNLDDYDEERFRKKFSSYTDYSIGFVTRGCIRGCSFCVNQHYKRCNLHSPVSEFLDPTRPYIYLLDDNVLACKEWKQVFDELQATGKRFQFKQGMDERLLTDEKCEVIFNSKWIGDFIFAFDNINDSNVIVEKLKMIRKHTKKTVKFYTFCGYNHDNPENYPNGFWEKDIRDLFERIRILMSFKALPYVMRYKDYELSPYKGMYITIARWCNQPSFVKKMSFREFCVANGDTSSAVKYMRAFESVAPEIAQKYFDMKWEE